MTPSPRPPFVTRLLGLGFRHPVYTDLMDLTELLRSQAKRYNCANCSENMGDCAIKVLAQQGSRALVRVTCVACQDVQLLQIIFQSEGDFGSSDDELLAPLFDEGMPAVEHPISADELLDVHAFLSSFNADLRQLVAPGSGS